MAPDASNECVWGSRRAYFAVVLCSVVGLNTYAFIPHRAVAEGALGTILVTVLTYATLGVPLLYMEHAIGQFTTRDCVQVWACRGFLSHMGYVHVLYQLHFVVYCHAVNAAVIHYLLISFEDPIPYFTCGHWRTKDCDIINTNYTVVQHCIHTKEPRDYCKDIHLTYPEYQYWRYYILGVNKTGFHVAWRVGLASLFLSVFVYISCCKGFRSVKYVLEFVSLYPTVGYIVLMIGSTMQKGIVVHYAESLDEDFSKFMGNFKLTCAAAEVLYGLNVGTGLSFNLASTTSFRSPVYANSVMAVFISCTAAILGICTTALMSCPYAFQFNAKPGVVLQDKLLYTFEKIPRLLHSYDSSSLWLVIFFSSIAVSAAGWQIITMAGLMEMLAKRKPSVAKYPGFVTLATVAILYVVTLPLVSNWAFDAILESHKTVRVVILLMVIIENLVFVLWYGLGRFSDDIHFMQGSQPGFVLKVCWVATSLVLGYIFCVELYHRYRMPKNYLGIQIGWWILCVHLAWIGLTPIVSLLIATCRSKFGRVVRLDPSWGPKCKVLRRSRAMFSAHSMTKEYIYRQYHLQAGIIERQRRSNVRNPCFGGRIGALAV